MRRIGITATLALVALLLAGCTSGASDSAGTSDSSLPSMTAPELVPGVVDEAARDSATGSDLSAAEGAIAREVVVQGQLRLIADDPVAAADEAVRVVESSGGRVDSRTEQPAANDIPASAQLVVRIPADRVTPVLDELSAIGEVAQLAVSKSDVTEQSRDIDARITALQASVDRLLALLSSATATADLIEVETALSTRQAELESLQAQRRSLSDQIDLATVSVDIGAPETAPTDRPDDFWSAIATGWESLGAVGAAVLIGFGVALPWLVLLGLVVLAVLAVRSVRRRRAGRTAAETGTPSRTPTDAQADPQGPPEAN